MFFFVSLKIARVWCEEHLTANQTCLAGERNTDQWS